jgi:heptosyltransferase-2
VRPDRRETVAVIRLDQIGDVVLTGPFLAALRRAQPEARIVMVVRPVVAELVARLDEVDEVLTLAAPGAGRGARVRKLLAELRVARDLKQRGTQVAIVPRWDLDIYDAIALARRSGARIRVGFDRAGGHGLTHVLDAPASEHEALKPLRLLGALGAVAPADLAPPRWYDGDDERAAAALLGEAGGGGAVPVAFGVAARERRREWPVERFAAVAQRIAEERPIVPVLVGGPADRATAARFAAAAGMPCTDLTGRTSLPVTAAALARCALFVGNDSAPMHLAAAGGVPVVELSCHAIAGDPDQSQSPARFGPHGVPSEVIQPDELTPPCAGSCEAGEPHCILAVAPEAVAAAASRLLGQRARG